MAYDISLRPIHRWLLAILIATAFLAPGIAIIPRLGIEVDEALIAEAIYEGGAPHYSWHFGGAEIPIMLMSYLGALKAWLYNAIFAFWTPSEMSLRLPTLLVGIVTIWLFWKLVRRVAGEPAAWIGAALLATDTAFLLTDAIDFGPVALQHLFKLGGLLLVLRFIDDGRTRWLGAGFFLFGLGLWDKAIFGWVLVGLGVAGIAVYARELRGYVSWKNLTVATAGLLLGAFPFLVYNVARPAETFRANATLQSGAALGKYVLVHSTMNGSVGFGFYVSGDAGPKPGTPQTFVERVAFQVSRWFGHPHSNLTEFAFILSLFALPFARSIWKPTAFALIFMFVTWLQMIYTSGAGGAAHHVILLWPAHLFVIALVLAQWRWGFAIAGVLCISGLLVTNQTLVDLVRSGPGLRWTDAIRPLTETLAAQNARHKIAIDWGIVESVQLLTEGNTSLVYTPAGDPSMNPKTLLYLVADEKNVFVTHTAGHEIRSGSAQRLGEIADGYHRERVLLETIYDRNGRAIFEVFRYRPKAVK